MSRDIGAANAATVQGSHVHIVNLVSIAFDDPVYAHSGYGQISYNGNNYLGVGSLGAISEAKESEVLGPSSITLTLSGIDPKMLAEALDSSNYGALVTIYEGYRQDDGTLVEDPWVFWRGTVEYATSSEDQESTINLLCQHDLAVVDERDNSRFTDEDQLQRYPGDRIFEFITQMLDLRLEWGGGIVQGAPPDNPGDTRGGARPRD